jgi:hypothetical protein
MMNVPIVFGTRFESVPRVGLNADSGWAVSAEQARTRFASVRRVGLTVCGKGGLWQEGDGRKELRERN